MHIRFIILFSFILFATNFSGQEMMINANGTIVDEESGNTIPFVHILIKKLNTGTITDENGKFSIQLPISDSIEIQFFHTSYETKTLFIKKQNINNIRILLTPKIYETDEIKIQGKEPSVIKEMIPGKFILKQKEILVAPALLGEPDIVRSLQLLPGIQSVNEGNSGIYVRGGSTGQNFILFDDIELMNPSHLMGIYSVFNPFLTEKVEFYKGNAPIELSSRLASSIIVKSFNNKQDSNNWNINIGNISTNLCYNGLSKNKKWYTNIGFRRSYLEGIQWVSDQLLEDEYNYFTKNKFNFYDFNGKLHYATRQNNITLAWYLGGDHFNYTNRDNAILLKNNWGNKGLSLNWNHIFETGILMKNTLSYSNYFSSLSIDFLTQDLNFDTDYHHLHQKTEITVQQHNQLIKFGLHSKFRDISPQNLDLNLNTSSQKAYYNYQHFIISLFGSDEFSLTDKLKLYVGGSVQYYQSTNKETSSNNDTNNMDADNADILKNGVFTFNFKNSVNSAFKGSFSHTEQNIHLASIASIPLPSDIWMPATSHLPAETGNQITLGYFIEKSSKNIQYGIEGFYKLVNNELLLNVNYQGKETDSFEDNFYTGKSKSYGAEFFVKKTSENFVANISYTLGWTQQKFNDINNGAWFDAKYDRRHDINILGSYVLNKKFDFGLVFILATGNKTTLPVGRYWMMGNINNVYDGVNNFRMPVYHRLDLSVNYHLESKTFNESVVNFSLINVLNHSNPYFIYLYADSGEENYELSVKAKQVSLFPILPSFSWKFKF